MSLAQQQTGSGYDINIVINSLTRIPYCDAPTTARSQSNFFPSYFVMSQDTYMAELHNVRKNSQYVVVVSRGPCIK